MIVVSLFVGCRVWIDSQYIKLDAVRGMTTSQVWERYGEPDWIVDDREIEEGGQLHWIYYSVGGGSSLCFDKDRVIRVDYKKER